MTAEEYETYTGDIVIQVSDTDGLQVLRADDRVRISAAILECADDDLQVHVTLPDGTRYRLHDFNIQHGHEYFLATKEQAS